MWLEVEDAGQHRLHNGKLRIKTLSKIERTKCVSFHSLGNSCGYVIRSLTQREEHSEEQDGPERCEGKPGDEIRVGDESKSSARVDHGLDLDAQLGSEKTKHREDGEAGEHGREAVSEAHNHGVP